MGDFIEFLYSRFLLSDGVSIDTRTLQKDNLFFAISGANFNANEFASEALTKGASYAVVDDESYVTDDRIILAEDSLKALQELAKFHRSRFKRPVIGITGSNGKTTTKELITEVLSKKYIVHATAGNYNNHIGVPLTLLHIHPQVEIAIIEMGANHQGEIGFLSGIASPTHGMITNIGHAHTEGFGGIEGVFKGKSELYDSLRNSGGIPFVNMNDPYLRQKINSFNNAIPYPENEVTLVSADPFVKLEVDGNECVTQLIGAYNFENMAASIAIGKHFDVPMDDILDAISSYVPVNARSEVVQRGSLTIIMDAYNANPDSMKAALKNLAGMRGRKVAILGDMNELDNEDEAHVELIAYAKELEIDLVLTVGEKIGKADTSENHFSSNETLSDYLKDQKFSDSTVLLKASRSIKLETVLDYIQP